ncbi:MAG: hypothetical protein ACI815_002062, partial [Psychroserpens sp.]
VLWYLSNNIFALFYTKGIIFLVIKGVVIR